MRLRSTPRDRLYPSVARQADAAGKLPPDRGVIFSKLTGLAIANRKTGVVKAVVLAVSGEQHTVVLPFKTSIPAVRSSLIRHA